jgi:hypothetical protein
MNNVSEGCFIRKNCKVCGEKDFNIGAYLRKPANVPRLAEPSEDSFTPAGGGEHHAYETKSCLFNTPTNGETLFYLA